MEKNKHVRVEVMLDANYVKFLIGELDSLANVLMTVIKMETTREDEKEELLMQVTQTQQLQGALMYQLKNHDSQ